MTDEFMKKLNNSKTVLMNFPKKDISINFVTNFSKT